MSICYRGGRVREEGQTTRLPLRRGQPTTHSQPATAQLSHSYPVTCNAGELSESAAYHEAMRSVYRAKWFYAMEREITRLEEAGIFGDE